MKYKLVAIDDEEPSVRLIEWFADKMDNIEFIKGFTSPEKALQFLHTQPVDILILDIEMPGLSGLDFAKMKQDKSKIIFSTAFPDYAVEGFNLSATDYLLKPYRFERFKEAIEKATYLLDFENNKNSEPEPDLFYVKVNYTTRPVTFNQVEYIESINNNISIHLVSGKTLVFRDTLKNLYERLPSSHFVRIHRSYIVPIKKIHAFNKQKVNLDKIELPVGEKYKNELVQCLNKHNIKLI